MKRSDLLLNKQLPKKSVFCKLSKFQQWNSMFALLEEQNTLWGGNATHLVSCRQTKHQTGIQTLASLEFSTSSIKTEPIASLHFNVHQKPSNAPSLTTSKSLQTLIIFSSNIPAIRLNAQRTPSLQQLSIDNVRYGERFYFSMYQIKAAVKWSQ